MEQPFSRSYHHHQNTSPPLQSVQSDYNMSTSGSRLPKTKPYSRGPSRVGMPELDDSDAIVLAAFKELKFQPKRIEYIFSLAKGEPHTRYIRNTIMPREAGNAKATAILEKFFPYTDLLPSTPAKGKSKAMQVDPATPTPQRLASPTSTQLPPTAPPLPPTGFNAPMPRYLDNGWL